MSALTTSNDISETKMDFSFKFEAFQPIFIIILILCFLVLFILLILLWQISFPKHWSGMISTPLFKGR